MRTLLTAALILTATSALAEPKSITADIWVDNWFEMYVNGEKVIEDSVSITTERSFNAETTTFTSDLPMIIAIMPRISRKTTAAWNTSGQTGSKWATAA